MTTKTKQLTGEQIYNLVYNKLPYLAKKYIVPEQLELPLHNYKPFMAYLDSNPEKKGGEVRLGYVTINNVTLYIAPVPKLVKEIVEEDETVTEEPLEYRLS
jgi:hypothetical protein